ncbi:MAG: phage holin family protein [Dermatophilaceae bacterium]
MSGTPGSERTIGQLVADVTHDVEGIVRGEIALAKAEILGGAKGIGKGAGLLAVAGFIALLGLIFLFHTVARVVDIWLPLWAGYGIVTAVMFVVAAVLALVGRSAIGKAKPAPQRAIDQAHQTVAALKQAGQSSGSPAPTDQRASA